MNQKRNFLKSILLMTAVFSISGTLFLLWTETSVQAQGANGISAGVQ
jgi:hypothetical protein